MGAVYKRNFPPGTFLTSLTIQNTLVVAKNGNDATGLRNLWNKPFLTIEAAEAQALSGDLIITFPGTYSPTSSLGKNGIKYEFKDGAIIDRADTIWNVNAINISVSGMGEFRKTGGGGSSGRIMLMQGAFAVNFECKRCDHSGVNIGIHANNASTGISYIKIWDDFVTTGTNVGIQNSGASVMYLTATKVTASASVAIASISTLSTGKMYVYANEIINTGSAGLINCIYSDGNYMEVHGRLLDQTTATTGISGAVGIGSTLGGGAGRLVVNGDIITNGFNPTINFISAVSAIVEINGKINTTVSGVGGVNAGDIVINTLAGNKITFNDDIIGYVENGSGVMKLTQGISEVRRYFKNIASAAASCDGIVKSGGTLILNGAVLVMANGVSLRGTTAQNAIVYSCMSNSAILNITNSINGTNIIQDVNVQ